MEAYDKENQKNLTDEQVLEATGEAQEKLHVTKNKGGIVVKGIHDVAVRFSKCCSPIPGDEIVGFVTRGRGITIHRTDCVNVLNMSEMDRSRLIEAEWQPTDNKGSEKYMAEIQVYANNRTGLHNYTLRLPARQGKKTSIVSAFVKFLAPLRGLRQNRVSPQIL